MGLTIHYTARLRDWTLYDAFVEEVEDICKTMQWKYKRLDITEDVDAKGFPMEIGEGKTKTIRLQGVFFTPPNCETVCLAFTNERWTCTPIHFETAASLVELDPYLPYSMHTKTQYAGIDMHVALVNLLKYLEQKYFSEMRVYDEGDYWNTLDKTILESHFAAYTNAINMVKSALENENWQVTDDPYKIATQIEELIKRKLK